MSQAPGQGETTLDTAVKIVVAVLTALSAALGYLTAWAGSLAAGLVVDVGLLIYVVALLTYARLRYIPLGLMTGADAGHLTYDLVVLHARVALYPLVEALSSLSGHVTYVFDPVQALVIAEVVYGVYSLMRKAKARSPPSEGQVPP